MADIGDLEAWFSEPAAPSPDQLPIVDIPATIYHKERGAFIVTDENAWAYVRIGLFAIGHWEDEDAERQVIIPYDRLDHVDITPRYDESSSH